MDDPSVRTPDSIEPISAYRAWFYSIEGTSAQLFPLSGVTMRTDWESAGREMGDRILSGIRVGVTRGAFGRLQLWLLLPQGS